MGMGQHHSSRILGKCQLHHLARMNTGAVDRTAEEFHVLNQPVAFIKEQYTEHFMLKISQFDGQKVLHQLRRTHRRSAAYLTIHDVARRLEDFFTRCESSTGLLVVYPQLFEFLVRHGRAPRIWAGLPASFGSRRAQRSRLARPRDSPSTRCAAQGLDGEHDVIGWSLEK